MFLGKYDFEGERAELLTAYDRLMGVMPPGQVTFHICITRPGGITVFDTCPSEADFAGFSSSPAVLGAMTAAGLPTPSVTPLGEAHPARAAADHIV